MRSRASSISSSRCLEAGDSGRNLREARAYPGAGVVARRRLDQVRGRCLHDPAQHARAKIRLRVERRIVFVAEQFDAGERQAVGLHAAREDAEAPLAARHHLQQAQLRHVPLDDARGAAYRFRQRRRADLAALADQAHAERRRRRAGRP